MIVVNFWGGPGSGKSTTAAGVFSLLKLHEVNCELVTEYAKELVWRGMKDTLKNQLYIFSQQYDRLMRVNGKVDVAVTDSPLLMNIIYNTEPELHNVLLNTFRACFNKFDNINYFITRIKPYQPVGRYQTENEARELDRRLSLLSLNEHLDGTAIEGNAFAIGTITGEILRKLGKTQNYSIAPLMGCM